MVEYAVIVRYDGDTHEFSVTTRDTRTLFQALTDMYRDTKRTYIKFRRISEDTTEKELEDFYADKSNLERLSRVW